MDQENVSAIVLIGGETRMLKHVQSDSDYRKKTSTRELLSQDLRRNPNIYLMLIPVVIFYTVFCYVPMFGLTIAFKDFSPRKGIWGSEWVGLKHFINFFEGPYAPQLIRNTVLLSLYSLIFGFPMPILLAFMIDEVRNKFFRRTMQTISYLPHFISIVVIVGIVKEFVSRDGLINWLILQFNSSYSPENLLNSARNFRPIYVISGIWQQVGWDSIIYLATLAGVDPQLYEAITIDGGNRFHRIWNVSLPSIMPTIIILFIMRMGTIMNVGFEKVFLLYSEANYDTSDVISTYVYRRGLINNEFSFASAVGLFNSVINFIMVYIMNKIMGRVSETSLF